MNYGLLIHSLGLSLGASLLALMLGVMAALAALQLRGPARRTLAGCAVMVLVLPAFLVLNAWFGLFGVGGVMEGWTPVPLFSFPMAVVIMGLVYWPLAFFPVFASWQSLNREVLDGEPGLRGMLLVRRVLVPSGAASASLAFVVVFTLSLNQFSIPALLQVGVYPVEIWLRFNAGMDARAALLASWPLVLLPALLLIWMRRRDVAWPRMGSGAVSVRWGDRLGWGIRFWVWAATLLCLAFSLVLPLGYLLGSPSTWQELGPALRAGRSALLLSGLLAAVTATTVVLLAWSRVRSGWFALGWITFLLPGVLIGIGLIVLLNRPWTDAVYHSLVIVVLAWGLRFFGPAWALCRRALGAVDPLLSEAARLEGASTWQHLRWVVVPQAGPMLAAAWMLVYVLCLWDTEVLLLIMPPGGETLALRVFNLLHYGHNGQVNALCLALVGMALLPGLGWGAVQLCRWGIRQFGGQRFPAASCLLGLTCLGLLGCRPENPTQAVLDSRIFSTAQVFGERGGGAGRFQKPRSVAADLEGNFYVVDMTARVQKFSAEGEYLLAWQMPETDLGKPKGMCRDVDGTILVLEPHYARVNRFSAAGELLEQWGDRGTNVGQIAFPRSIVVDPATGLTFISEYMQSERVQVFGEGHRLERVIGRAGRAPGEFNRVEGVAVDGAGNLYAADSCNHRVQVFGADGQFIRVIGQPGSGPGEMSYPYDVEVDAEGRLFVCEFGNSRIQVFEAGGAFLEIIGGPGIRPGEFNNPWSIALDPQGNLYVADALNHRVQKLTRRRSLSPVPQGELQSMH
ncbi:MAG: Serine/threonine-protein kinase PknD [Verrucomicrobiota bacterium]|jgi:ABC-type Fe3+ transport system permease subunit/DNA-binding beta-propeller fold protein YncE